MNQLPIKVLHVLGLFDYGGAEALVMNIFRNIDRTKIMFDFVVHSEEIGAFEEEAQSLGAKIYRVPKYTGLNHLAYSKSWTKLFENHSEYKIIHGHVRSTANIYLKIAKRFGVKTIAHSHSVSSGSGLSAIVKNSMQKSIRNTAENFLACSVEAGEWLFGQEIIESDRFSVMNNAIDAEKFLFDPDVRAKARNKLGITNQFVLGHIGRLHESKNHMRILEIFRIFQKNYENSLLLLVGDGPLRESIEMKIAELKLEDKVWLLGSRENTHELLQAMDVFIFPSIYEGLGISVVEAQANSLPSVISTAVPEEAIFTDIVYSLSLESENQHWIETIERLRMKNREQSVTLEDIKIANYEIKEVSDWYTFYIQRLANN